MVTFLTLVKPGKNEGRPGRRPSFRRGAEEEPGDVYKHINTLQKDSPIVLMYARACRGLPPEAGADTGSQPLPTAGSHGICRAIRLLPLEARPTLHFVGRKPNVVELEPAAATTGAMDLAKGGLAGLLDDVEYPAEGGKGAQTLGGRMAAATSRSFRWLAGQTNAGFS